MKFFSCNINEILSMARLIEVKDNNNYTPKNLYKNPTQGNLSKIPSKLFRFIATTGECPEQRIQREKQEDKLNEQVVESDSFYFGVYDTVEHFVNFYYGFHTTRREQFTKMLNKIFAGVLIPWSSNQVINARGNGLCAYNCLYMFLTMNRPDILELFDSGGKFSEFKTKVRDMAVNSLDPEIKEFMTPLVDDPSTPDLDPIFTAFVAFTGINILMVNINDNAFTFTKSKFEHKNFPCDYIVIIRKACHLMYLHSKKDFTHRQLMYQIIESNICL